MNKQTLGFNIILILVYIVFLWTEIDPTTIKSIDVKYTMIFSDLRTHEHVQNNKSQPEISDNKDGKKQVKNENLDNTNTSDTTQTLPQLSSGQIFTQSSSIKVN